MKLCSCTFLGENEEVRSKRTQILNSDCEIKPDKWQIEFDGNRPIGVDLPCFQNFFLHEDGTGVYQIKSHSNSVRTEQIQVQLPSHKGIPDASRKYGYTINQVEITIITKEIWNFFWKELSTRDKVNPSYIVDGIFIYSINRVIIADPFEYRVNYILRWAPKLNYKDLRILRDEKIEQILYEKEV